MNNILLIGAGQLGSRHLQAMASTQHLLNIQVVDPNEESLQIAKLRFEEVSQNFKGEIAYLNSIDSVTDKVDIAIVASNSIVRRSIIQELLARIEVANLVLEKFLFPKFEDYDAVEKLLSDKKVTAWVNCPRRMMEGYTFLQEHISTPIRFNAYGKGWGMGSNGIHLLDIFAYITKENNIELNNLKLSKTIIDSKRQGYIEFEGIISGSSNANHFIVESREGEPTPLKLEIDAGNKKFTIKEGVKAVMEITNEDNDIIEQKEFDMPFQSQLTNIVIDEILSTGKCSLTPYEESATLHKVYLNCLLSHLRIVKSDETIDECRIT